MRWGGGSGVLEEESAGMEGGVGWISECKEGRFLGTSFSEKKMKSSAESWEEEGRRL